MAGDGSSGGSMVNERQEGGVLHGGNLGEAEAASCFPGPAGALELQVQFRAGGRWFAVRLRKLDWSGAVHQAWVQGQYG